MAPATAPPDRLLGPFQPDQVVRQIGQGGMGAGETERAVEIAESLAGVREAPTIFARARIHAMAFGNTADEAQAVRAVELLTELVGRGLDDVQRLRNDPDLKSLQKRSHFPELLRSIGSR